MNVRMPCRFGQWEKSRVSTGEISRYRLKRKEINRMKS